MIPDDIKKRLEEIATGAPPDQRGKIEQIMARMEDSQRDMNQMLEKELERQRISQEQFKVTRSLAEARNLARKETEQGFAQAFEEQNSILTRIVSR